MNRLKEVIAPKSVLCLSLLVLALLYGLSIWQQGGFLFGQKSFWLQENERINVDLSAQLETLQGKSVSLKDFDEGVLFLNFWATWCGPCRAEMPSIAALSADLGRKGLKVIAVTDEDPELVKAFLERSPYPFEVLIDRGSVLTRRLKIWSIPWTLVFDRQRRLVHFHEGAQLWDTPEIKANLQRVLDE